MIRIFNSKGHEEYIKWIKSLKCTPASPPPESLLIDPATSYKIDIEISLPKLESPNKFELANSLLPVFEEIRKSEFDLNLLPNFWDSLSLQYFKYVCPQLANGHWKPNRMEHYCYSDDWKLRHRHRISGPIILVKFGGEFVKGFLFTEPYILGEFEEQVGSRQELVGNRAALQTLAYLYTNKEESSTKRGFTSNQKDRRTNKRWPAKGTLRRFYSVHNQLCRNYDLFGINANAFLELLPQEFDKWKSAG